MALTRYSKFTRTEQLESRRLLAFGPFTVEEIGDYEVGSYVATDFDGDGDQDLVRSKRRVFWHENVDGTFSERKPLSANVSGRNVHAADFDNDGDMDLAAELDGRILWYENIRDNVLFRTHNVTAPIGSKILDVDDMNIDGLADILHETESSFGWTSNDNGTFDSCLLYTSPSPRDKRQSRMPSSA